MGKIKVLILLVVLAVISNKFYNTFRDGDLQKIPEGFWGPKNLQSKEKEDTQVRPFKINVEDQILKSLKSRLGQELNSTRYTSPLEGIGFEYGFNTNYLQKVLTYWHTKYDWRAREKLLNKYTQFKTKIAGIDIHFQHVKVDGSKYKDTKALLILHGWPGSFVELQKIIPLLTQPENSDFNFELIIPSLPGYGFSEPASRPGMGPAALAQIFLKLMQRLGHDQFYVQGGDWGSLIVADMATMFPQNVKAMHANICFSQHPRSFLRMFISSLFPSFVMTPEEAAVIPSFSKYFSFFMRETGYLHIQATKPDTVGVALSQSPSGLAAYILEKFSTWTNEAGIHAEDGLLEKSAITMDELLDNVMVYWVTNSITTSMRLYSEGFGPREMGYGLDSVPIQVPTGCMHTKDPYDSQSRWMLLDKHQNLVSYTMANKGGHFFAMEQPKLLADDVIQFVKTVEK